MINITNMTEDKYFSIYDVSKMLKVAYLTVYRWIQADKLKAYKAGKQYRIKEADLNSFLEEGRRKKVI